MTGVTDLLRSGGKYVPRVGSAFFKFLYYGWQTPRAQGFTRFSEPLSLLKFRWLIPPQKFALPNVDPGGFFRKAPGECVVVFF